MMIRKTITLTAKQDAWVKSRIAGGNFTNDSEYIRDLIRRDQEQYLDAEEWQLGEIEAGIADLDAGRTVSHDQAKAWLESWGSSSERTPPQ